MLAALSVLALLHEPHDRGGDPIGSHLRAVSPAARVFVTMTTARPSPGVACFVSPSCHHPLTGRP